MSGLGSACSARNIASPPAGEGVRVGIEHQVAVPRHGLHLGEETCRPRNGHDRTGIDVDREEVFGRHLLGGEQQFAVVPPGEVIADILVEVRGQVANFAAGEIHHKRVGLSEQARRGTDLNLCASFDRESSATGSGRTVSAEKNLRCPWFLSPLNEALARQRSLRGWFARFLKPQFCAQAERTGFPTANDHVERPLGRAVHEPMAQLHGCANRSRRYAVQHNPPDTPAQGPAIANGPDPTHGGDCQPGVFTLLHRVHGSREPQNDVLKERPGAIRRRMASVDQTNGTSFRTISTDSPAAWPRLVVD